MTENGIINSEKTDEIKEQLNNDIIEHPISKWSKLKNILQNKTSLESSVNLLRTKTIEQFSTECHNIYEKKIIIQKMTDNNSKILTSPTLENCKLPTIKILDCSSNLNYYEEIEKFLFTFRSNNQLMLSLVECLNEEQCDLLAPFLCHFFYENFYSESSEQGEILYLIYLLIEKEIDSLNTPSISSFLDTPFLNKFLLEFANRYEIKCYINQIMYKLIQKLESTSPVFYSFESLLNSKMEDEILFKQSLKDEPNRISVVETKKRITEIQSTEQKRQSESKGYYTEKNPFSNKNDLRSKLDIYLSYDLSENMLRKNLESEEIDHLKKLIILKHLKYCRNSNNFNLFSNEPFINHLLKQKINFSNEVLDSYANAINLVQNFIVDLFNNLENETIIPYCLKCICKMIYVLIEKKFKNISQLEKNNFICEFFFGKFILPLLLNPDICDVGCNMIISMSTRKNCFNIYTVLKNFLRGEFFSSDISPNLTVFNTFIFENNYKIDNFVKKIIKVTLPHKLEKLLEEFYIDDDFTLDYEKRKKLIDYDYFEENPNDFMQHQSICFNLKELVEFITTVEENKMQILSINNDEDFKKSFEKISSFKEYFDNKISQNNKNDTLEYYVIINDVYTKDKKELLEKKEKIVPLPAKNKNGCINEIKYCISYLLSRLDIKPHYDWITENYNTIQCFECIYKITKSFDLLYSSNNIPLSWYCLYVNNNLNNLPPEYKENDFNKLYEDLYIETEKKIGILKDLNDFLTIQVTTKFSFLEQKIKNTQIELENIKDTELNIKILRFIETTEIDVCLTNYFELKNLCDTIGINKEKYKDFSIEKFCESEKEIFINNSITKCVHYILKSPQDPQCTKCHCHNINEFAEKFANYKDIDTDINSDTSSSKTKARDVLEEYMNIVCEEVDKKLDFFIDTSNIKYGDNNNNEDRYDRPSTNIQRSTEDNQRESSLRNTYNCCNENDYKQKIKKIIWNYIIKKRCINHYKDDPIFEDVQFMSICKKLSWVDPEKNLELDGKVFNKDIFELIKEHIVKMDNILTPEEKLEEFGYSVQLINNLFTFTINKQRAEAGELLPMIIYGIIIAKPKRLVWSCRFMKFFLSDNEKLGNNGYNLTQIESSINFIKGIKASTLKITEEEFNKNCQGVFYNDNK